MIQKLKNLLPSRSIPETDTIYPTDRDTLQNQENQARKELGYNPLDKTRENIVHEVDSLSRVKRISGATAKVLTFAIIATTVFTTTGQAWVGEIGTTDPIIPDGYTLDHGTHNTFLEWLESETTFSLSDPDHSYAEITWRAENTSTSFDETYTHFVYETSTTSQLTFSAIVSGAYVNENGFLFPHGTAKQVKVVLDSGNSTYTLQDVSFLQPYEGQIPSLNGSIRNTMVGVNKVHNVVYDSTYDGNTFAYDFDNITQTSKKNCNTLDITCQLANLANTFTDMGEFIVAGIAVLFVPDNTAISNSFTNLKDSAYSQFGFLSQAAGAIVQFFNADINCTSSGVNQICSPFPTQSITLAGSSADLKLDLDVIRRNNWLTPIQTTAQVITTLLLIKGIHRKYLETVTA